jgi:hypothetical protein
MSHDPATAALNVQCHLGCNHCRLLQELLTVQDAAAPHHAMAITLFETKNLGHSTKPILTGVLTHHTPL